MAVEYATFAAGCFWHVEDLFRRIRGVLVARSGYAGGGTKNPTYESVCTGTTGHAESVMITYDSSVVGYDKLLDAFWSCHDPTTRDRQGYDIGTQYRSVIFYHTLSQAEAARRSLATLDSSGKYTNPIVTQIVPASEFYEAEEYHQEYIRKAEAAR